MLKVTEMMMRMAFLNLGNPRIITTQYPLCPDTQTLLAGPTLNRKQRRDNNVTSKTTEYQQSFLLAQAFKPSFTEL